MAFGNSIIARLGLDSREFRDGLSSAQKQLSSFGAVQSVGALFTGAGIKNVLDYADHIQRLSERYQVNTTSLQHLIQAGNLYDVSSETIAKGLQKLEVNSSRATSGNKLLQDSFARLNVSVDDLRTLSPEDLLKKIGSSSMNAADLVKVLGRNALELRPTLKAIADGTAEFGSAIDAIDIKKLSDANEELKKLGNEQKVFWAGVLATAADGGHILRNDARNLAEDTKNIWSAAFGAIANLAKGKFSESTAESEKLFQAIKQHASDLLFYRENPGALKTPNANINLDERVTPAKSKAELTAEQKERERTELKLSDLQEGPTSADFNRASAQAVYNAEQARRVKELEKQASDLLLNQADTSGARSILNRADEMRQGISTLSETEKQVGAFKQAIDDSKATQFLQTIAEEAVSE